MCREIRPEALHYRQRHRLRQPQRRRRHPDTIPTRRRASDNTDDALQAEGTSTHAGVCHHSQGAQHSPCATWAQHADLNLSRLGIFNSINIEAFPRLPAAEPTLDVAIDCTFDAPLEAKRRNQRIIQVKQLHNRARRHDSPSKPTATYGAAAGNCPVGLTGAWLRGN